MSGAPALTFAPSSGPAVAEGDATSGGLEIGDFIFQGSSSKNNGTSWITTIAPAAIVGLGIWLIYRNG